MPDDDVLDPRAVEWFEANPMSAQPLEDFSSEILELARGDFNAFPVTHEIARITDDVVEGVRVRIYRNDTAPAGLVVYFHGGGHCIGSVGLMDNLARELAHGANAVVVSVEYRLAPEHPYPEGLDDCEVVTRWALANAEQFGVRQGCVAIAGESAGANLAAAVTLRLRDRGEAPAGQVLMYPPVDANSKGHRSRHQFAGIVLTRKQMDLFWDSYAAGRNLERDPFAAPLQADTLAGLPPAFVVVGGCDPLRDEGLLYAARLRDDGVRVEEMFVPGQPHGFLNFGLPAAAEVFERIGAWLSALFARAAQPA
jgi:acetyl esterase